MLLVLLQEEKERGVVVPVYFQLIVMFLSGFRQLSSQD